MGKLSRNDILAHERACKLLEKDGPLSDDDIVDVLENWHEGATHANARNSAHFTPFGLARDFSLEIRGPKVLDLCAGIGTLSVAAMLMGRQERPFQYVLVEINEDYAAVARRLLPEAEVIVGSVFDAGLRAELASRRFDTAISNPPYGNFSTANGKAPRYRGSDGHYSVIDIASDLADEGAFIIPQQAAPFRYSGRNGLQRLEDADAVRYAAFRDQTGIAMEPGVGIDTAYYAKDWRGVAPAVEIVLCDFVEARKRRLERDLPLLAA